MKHQIFTVIAFLVICSPLAKANETLTIDVADGATQTYTAQLGAGVDLVKTGTGKLIVSNDFNTAFNGTVTIKAGILEIGDVFCVNKADHDGADKLVREINMMLDLDDHGPAQPQNSTQKALADQFHHMAVGSAAAGNTPLGYWRPPVDKVIANQNVGVKELIADIEKHFAYIQANGTLAERRTKRTKDEMLDILSSNIGKYITGKIVETGRLDAYVEKIKARETDPYTVVGDIMKEMLR